MSKTKGAASALVLKAVRDGGLEVMVCADMLCGASSMCALHVLCCKLPCPAVAQALSGFIASAHNTSICEAALDQCAKVSCVPMSTL